MTEKKSKIVSLVLIALMFGAIFGALPAITSGASESENGTISITITDDSGDAVPAGFVVNLYDTYADSMSEYKLSTDGYLKMDVPAGHYVIDLPAQIVGGKAYLFTNSDIFAVESGKTVSLSMETDSMSLNNEVKGTVTYSGNPVEGVTIELIDYSNDFTFSTTTDENGNYTLVVYDGHYSIWAEKKGVGRFYNSRDINGDVTVDIALTDVPYIKGFVFDQDGNGIESALHVTIYNASGDILKTYVGTGPFFKVPAFQGDFSVLIAAYGYDSYYNASVSTDNSGSAVDADLGNIQLNAIAPSSDHSVFTFQDFNNMSMVRTLTYAPYDAISAESNYESANIRYQLDTNHDGTVNASEASAFIDTLQDGMQPVSTGESLMVNGIAYDIVGTATVDVDGVEGSVSSSDPITVVVSADFKAKENISTDEISVSALVRYDSEFKNYSYSIVLPAGYERASAETPSDVSVSGYTTVDVDPASGDGSARISFGVVESENGEASIDVPTGEFVYEKNETTYIVKVGKNATFNAVFDDPNGHEDEANYTWTMDGTTLYGKSVEHAFSSGDEYTVNLTVTDVGGKKAYAEITVLADDSAPSAVAKPNSPINADEKEKIEFNASASTDKVFGSTDGVIVSYHWDFGDGNSSVQEIAEHAYEKWGTYTVTLNVTDAVGNYDTTTITVNIRDITAPVAIFNWTDADNETHSSDDVGTATVTKGDTISFDASPSYDPSGFEGADAGISSYKWYFEDTDSTADGKTVTHTFNDVGTYAVKLNVTDGHGNYREITKLFEVKHGPVPRLEVKNLTLSTDEPRAGQTIQIIANISNFGDADANSPNVIFYVNDKALSGNVRFYVYDNGSLVEASSTIPAGEYRIVKIDWTPEKGSVKLKVNVTDAAEPSFSFLNEKEIKVTVGQPVWMDYIPVILALAAIVGVVAIYVMYSKGMGPFGEKKEKK